MKHIAALLLAGSFFFGWAGKVSPDVVIDGVPVGGMTYAEAEEAVRREREPIPLVVHAPGGDLDLSGQLSVSDDLPRLVRGAKRGDRLSSHARRYLADESVLYDLCRKNAREGRDAVLVFTAAGFSYTHEIVEIGCDYHALVRDVSAALACGRREVTLRCVERTPAVTEKSLRDRTRPLARFATSFDPSNAPRAHNIALAVSRISGTVLSPGEEFSFNRAVGSRSAENGFEIASVILDGAFVPGVGGGVCQASTTLFGAALRAGMTVTESRAHSLSVSYVPPSLDAMVSETSDLKFVNPFSSPVYILGRTENGRTEFCFFGLPDGKSYRTESVVLDKIAPPPPETVSEGARAEKEGIVSESYLCVYRGERLLSRTLIRRDRYAPVQGRTLQEEETQRNCENGAKNVCFLEKSRV